MSRILVGDGFKASQLPVEFFGYLQALPDDVTVLLEFVSPGPASRQIDAALLGPGGVDVIELKRYRGTIAGEANGPWMVTFNGRQQVISNRRGATEENPYTQAQNASDDLKQWIRRIVGRSIRARAAVLVTPGNQMSVVQSHNYVKFANGVGDLERILFNRQHAASAHLVPDEIDRIVAELGMHVLGASTFRGVVQDAMTGAPLSGVQVQVEGLEEPLRTTRDGSFSFVFGRGEAVGIRILPPAGYHEYEVVEHLSSAEMRQYYQVRPLATQDGVEALEARLMARIELLEKDAHPSAASESAELGDEPGVSNRTVEGLSAQVDELRHLLDTLRANRQDDATIESILAALQKSIPWRSRQAAVVDMGYASFMDALQDMQPAELAVLVATLEKITLTSITRGVIGQGVTKTVGAVQQAGLGNRFRSIATRVPTLEAPARMKGFMTGARSVLDRGSLATRDMATSIGSSGVGRYAASIASSSSQDFVTLAQQIEDRATELRHLEAGPLKARLADSLLARAKVTGPRLSPAAYHAMLLSIAPAYGIRGETTFATADLARLVFDASMRDIEKVARERSATMSPEEKQVVIRELDGSLSVMSPAQQRAVARSLGVDKATGEIVFQSFAAGGIAFGSLAVAGSTGFGLYLAATTVLHAIATTMFGVTLSFGVYTGLTSAIAFLLSPPVFAAVGLGAAGAVIARRGPQLAKRVVGMVLVQVLYRTVVAGVEVATPGEEAACLPA